MANEQVLTLLRTDHADPEAYLSYLREGVGDRQVVGDMTPAYAMLSADRLAQMARLGGRAKFVYLMRDPVSRLWSHVRMQAIRQRDARYSDELKARRIMNRVIKKGAEPHIPARGDYRGTYDKLLSVAAAEDCLFEFTENLGSEASTQKICTFLGIDHVSMPRKDKVHQGAEIKMREAHREVASEFLAAQYRFAKRTFKDLPPAWEKHMEFIR